MAATSRERSLLVAPIRKRPCRRAAQLASPVVAELGGPCRAGRRPPRSRPAACRHRSRPRLARLPRLARRPRAAGRPRPGCWSGDDRGGPALAPGGTLGGSQAGARLLYRLGGGLALSGRALCAAAADARAPRPRPGSTGGRRRACPIHLLAERRQAAGRRGPLGLRAHALWRRRPDAAARPARSMPMARRGSSACARATCSSTARCGSRAPIGPVEIGGGAWGAAQPGAARLDAGPIVS